MMQFGQQRTAEQQVNVSFLVGLDRTVPQQWQRVREREKTLEQLKEEMSDGAFGAIIGSATTLSPAPPASKQLLITNSSLPMGASAPSERLPSKESVPPSPPLPASAPATPPIRPS
jgi:hypothetical protein